MKKKSTLSQSLTKQDIKGVEGRLSKVEKTLGELGKGLGKEIEMIERSLRLEVISSSLSDRQRLESSLKENLKETVTKLKDDLFNKIDPLLGEILTAREDRTITTHYVTGLQEKVEEHEERLTKLETAKTA